MNAPTITPGALLPAMREADLLGELVTPNGEIALVYARAGMRVFPVRPDTRRPYLPAPAPGKGGFHQRSADPETIKSWWQKFPDALIGIVPGDAGLAAYDVDTTNAARAAVARGLLDPASFGNGSRPTGLTVASGGKSQPFKLDGITLPPMHRYFEIPRDAKAGDVLLKDVVTRYQDGYVVAPGSWHRTAEGVRTYTLLSDGLPQPLPPVRETQSQHAEAGGDDTPLGILLGAPIPQGNRHTTMLKVSAYLAARMPSEAVLLAELRRIDRTQCTPPLSTDDVGDNELADIAYSAWKKFGATGNGDALYSELTALNQELAELEGPRRAAREAQRLGEMAAKHHADRRAVSGALDALRSSDRQRADKWAAIDPGHTLVDAIVQAGDPYLVRRVLFQQSDHFLFGEPQALKTFAALALSMAIATGRPWLNTYDIITPGLVVIFAGEGQLNLRRRLAASLAALGISAEEAQKIPIRIYDQLPILGRGEEGTRIAITKIEEAEREFGQPVRLVVFDTLTRLSGRAGLSMVDVQDFGSLLEGISSIGKRFNASTLTLAHSPKSDPNNASGTFQLKANADCVIKATRLETRGSEFQTLLHFDKTKDGETPEDILLRFRKQDFTELLAQSLAARGKDGPDADDAFADKYTSLACVWDGSTALTEQDRCAVDHGLSEDEQRVLSILAELIPGPNEEWVGQQRLFEAAHAAYEATSTRLVPDTTLRRRLDRLHERGLVQPRYVDPKRKQAGIAWSLTDEGRIETMGLARVGGPARE